MMVHSSGSNLEWVWSDSHVIVHINGSNVKVVL